MQLYLRVKIGNLSFTSVFNTSDFGDPCSTVDGEYLGPNCDSIKNSICTSQQEVINNTSLGSENSTTQHCTTQLLNTNVAQCRYRGFRNGPGEENQYENSDVWMHVFTARLVFIVVFEVTGSTRCVSTSQVC